ncbi:hypothetical protein [Nostoc sp.]|uniref:hypothetical protein n=1 Tax=Nostoc sp. TaxID=1180 RepID=UPI002FF8A456
MPLSNIYKLSLVSMSGRSQLVIKSSEKLSRLSMSDRQGLSLAMSFLTFLCQPLLVMVYLIVLLDHAISSP